jgi:hypothetical protein
VLPARDIQAWFTKWSCMPRSALDLARALKRYTRMRPENAYVALARDWPQPIVALVSDVLWSEVKGRTAKEITCEILALMRKADAAHKTVEAVKCRERGARARPNRR